MSRAVADWLTVCRRVRHHGAGRDVTAVLGCCAWPGGSLCHCVEHAGHSTHVRQTQDQSQLSLLAQHSPAIIVVSLYLALQRDCRSVGFYMKVAAHVS